MHSQTMYASSFTLLDLSSKEQMVGSLLPGVDVTLTVQWKITEAPKLAQTCRSNKPIRRWDCRYGQNQTSMSTHFFNTLLY